MRHGALGNCLFILSPALGSPIVPSTVPIAQKEIQRGEQVGGGTEREAGFIHALALIYQDVATVPYRTRASNYERAMSDLASKNREDVEVQVF